MRPRHLFVALAVACTSCTVGPQFHRPAVQSPADFNRTPDDVASRTYGGAVDVSWWEAFKDPELDALIGRLSAQNLQLQQAAERVAEARAEVQLNQAQSLPQLNADASYTRERQSANGIATLFEPAPGAPLAFDQFDPKLTASWELDLFGRIRRQTEAARANADASVEDRHGIALAVLAELAQDYFQYRQVQASEALTRRNIEIAARRLSLVNDLVHYGAASSLSSGQAQAQLAQIRAGLPAILQQKAALSNAIALLLAEPPRSLDAELNRQSAGQPTVPRLVAIDLPADIIRQRPDIRQAEAQLHAATAETGAAVAGFYPDVTFSSSFGFESLHPGSLFDWASRTFSIAPSISLPIFHGGALEGNLRLAQARQREAEITFRHTVLKAWHEVDNALTGYARTQETLASATAVERANERALKLATEQFQRGAGNFLNVVDGQTALIASQSATLDARLGTEVALVSLYRSLGGGWQLVSSPVNGKQ